MPQCGAITELIDKYEKRFDEDWKHYISGIVSATKTEDNLPRMTIVQISGKFQAYF